MFCGFPLRYEDRMLRLKKGGNVAYLFRLSTYAHKARDPIAETAIDTINVDSEVLFEAE